MPMQVNQETGLPEYVYQFDGDPENAPEPPKPEPTEPPAEEPEEDEEEQADEDENAEPEDRPA